MAGTLPVTHLLLSILKFNSKGELSPCPWTTTLPGNEKAAGTSPHFQNESGLLSLSLVTTEGIEGDHRAFPGNRSEALRQIQNSSVFVQDQENKSCLTLLPDAHVKSPPAYILH